MSTFEAGEPSLRRQMPDHWRPYLREAALIRTCLDTGLTALARANHADTGLYAQAFFSVHAGLERLLKLIYVIDSALTHGGTLPTDEDLRRRFGHDLVPLFAMAADVRDRLEADGHAFRWGLVDAEVAGRIIGVLAEFGKASRYYNLDYLVGSKRTSRDPVAAWATEVGAYLIKDYPSRRAAADAGLADFAHEVLGDRSSVVRDSETGDAIADVRSEVLHGRRGEWVQEAATFHAATIVRYLAEILRALNTRCLRGDALELPFLWEFFGQYNNGDRDLRGRRTFL
jgi:hypothetical protein